MRTEDGRDARLLGRQLPGQSTPPAGTFTQVAGGRQHTCGLKTDGTLACWGDNSTARARPPPGRSAAGRPPAVHTPANCRRTGRSSAGGTTSTARARPPPARSPRSPAAAHTCGLKTDGTLACWGDNGFGQSTPPAGTFTQVAAGDASHVRTEDGRHARLLGGRLLRPEHAARRDVHRRSPRATFTRAGGRRTGRSPAGGTTATARARPPPGRSRRSPPALTRAGCRRTARSPAGGQRLRPEHAPRRDLHRRSPPALSHVRPEDGRDARLLGPQRLRAEHPPAGTFTQVAAGGLSHLRGEDGRGVRLLGGQRHGQVDMIFKDGF